MVNAPGAAYIAHGEKLKRYVHLAGATEVKTPGAAPHQRRDPRDPSTLGSRGLDYIATRPLWRLQ